jgi:hypothetical protein
MYNVDLTNAATKNFESFGKVKTEIIAFCEVTIPAGKVLLENIIDLQKNIRGDAFAILQVIDDNSSSKTSFDAFA